MRKNPGSGKDYPWPTQGLLSVEQVSGKTALKTDDRQGEDQNPDPDLDDLAWVPTPSAWHQQAVRIVDHPFTTLAELREFALNAKKAGGNYTIRPLSRSDFQGRVSERLLVVVTTSTVYSQRG